MITFADIQAVCTPEEIASRNEVMIAAKMSVGRTRISSVSREVFATWAAKYGVRAKIEDYAATSDHPLRSISLALIDVLRSPTAGIDFSVADNLAMLQAWVTTGDITQTQADELITIATVPDPVSPYEVTSALEGN